MPEVNKKQFHYLYEVLSQVFFPSNYASESAKVLKITLSMLNIFFTFGFRARIVFPGYRKSYLRNPEMYSCLTFDLYFKVKPGS
jgi:hypothetical protein